MGADERLFRRLCRGRNLNNDAMSRMKKAQNTPNELDSQILASEPLISNWWGRDQLKEELPKGFRDSYV